MSDAIAAFAVLYGPATCGCVPLTKTRDAERLTYAQQAKWKDQRGWTRCPICKGSGVDPRVESGITAMNGLGDLLTSLSCR